MKRYASHIVIALLTFAVGVSCVFLLNGSMTAWFERVRGFVFAVLMLVPSAICFCQAFHRERGLRRSVAYNMLMLSLSVLLFVVGFIVFFVTLVVTTLY
jgi:hypothetical protein